jgi:pectinesterase
MIKLLVTPKDDIQLILNNYPLNQMIELRLSPGIYHQKLHLEHKYLKLIGHHADDTKITYNDYSYKMHQDGLLYNTFRTSTVTILSDYVSIENITIENTSGYGLKIGQAVALSLYGDHTKVRHCVLSSYQDTLFVGPLPIDLTQRYDDFLLPSQLKTKQLHHMIEHTTIEGDIDYVFGSGVAFFNTCKFVSKRQGFVFAPSTYASFPYGFIVYNSTIITGNDHTLLARPWREHGRLILINTVFQGNINLMRYDDWQKENYYFFEHPYVQNSFSLPLKKEEIEQLNNYTSKYFNCSIKT